MTLRKFLQKALPTPVFNEFVVSYARLEAAKSGLGLQFHSDRIDVCRGEKVIRVGRNHLIYLNEIIGHFEYYWSAVNSVRIKNHFVVDYSYPRYHDVVGFDLHPIVFPSFAEPVDTTSQYMDFAGLQDGMTVIDLGAYSGLTSIIFQEAVGKKGKVVAVDADDQNVECIEKNFDLYEKVRGVKISLITGAVWDNNDGLEFSSEGNMGASAAAIVGSKSRGSVKLVPSFTLSRIAEMSALDTIDFIKCDVEGAERVVFNDGDFFKRYKPRLIVETHRIGESTTTAKCISDLTSYGYTCEEVVQTGGSATPLLACYVA